MWMFIIIVAIAIVLISACALVLLSCADHTLNCPKCGGEVDYIGKTEDGKYSIWECRKCGERFLLESRD